MTTPQGLAVVLDAVVDLPPKSKGRPRTFQDKRGQTRTVTPGDTKGWEAAAGWFLRAAWRNRPPLDQPVAVAVRAVHARPRKRPKDVPADAWADGGRLVRPRTPDLDNVVKATWDALVACRVLRDDAPIVLDLSGKFWAAAGERPHVRVVVAVVGWKVSDPCDLLTGAPGPRV